MIKLYNYFFFICKNYKRGIRKLSLIIVELTINLVYCYNFSMHKKQNNKNIFPSVGLSKELNSDKRSVIFLRN